MSGEAAPGAETPPEHTYGLGYTGASEFTVVQLTLSGPLTAVRPSSGVQFARWRGLRRYEDQALSV